MKRRAKPSDAGVRRAIARAERLLPGVPASDGEEDARWQAIIEVGHFIEEQPEPIWEFVLRWGKHPQQDLRMALACCLLEHLLEYHFDLIFPRLAEHARRSRRFARMTAMCDMEVMASATHSQWRAFQQLLRECFEHEAALHKTPWYRARQWRSRKRAVRDRARIERSYKRFLAKAGPKRADRKVKAGYDRAPSGR